MDKDENKKKVMWLIIIAVAVVLVLLVAVIWQIVVIHRLEEQLASVFFSPLKIVNIY